MGAGLTDGVSVGEATILSSVSSLAALAPKIYTPCGGSGSRVFSPAQGGVVSTKEFRNVHKFSKGPMQKPQRIGE